MSPTEKPADQDKGIKNPENEAKNPGGTPTELVRGSAPPRPHDLEGQQGATQKDT
jgi:hypothetical protein